MDRPGLIVAARPRTLKRYRLGLREPLASMSDRPAVQGKEVAPSSHGPDRTEGISRLEDLPRPQGTAASIPAFLWTIPGLYLTLRWPARSRRTGNHRDTSPSIHRLPVPTALWRVGIAHQAGTPWCRTSPTPSPPRVRGDVT